MNISKPSHTSVILLAAGHGTRMRPLTDSTPKPLLKVNGKALIEHHIDKLGTLGFEHIVINTAYLGHQIQQQLGDGSAYGVRIDYSDESNTGALETAGGIKKSLNLIQSDPFIAVNADIYTDFNFSLLLEAELTTQGGVVLVPNPEHNQSGDFGIRDDNRINHPGNCRFNKQLEFDADSITTMTFSGIALYQKQMFDDLPEGKLALGPILKQMIADKQLTPLGYYGDWTDVGTPKRLQQLNLSDNEPLRL